MKSIRLLLFLTLLACLGLMPVAAGPRHADTPSVQPPAPTPAPEQTPPEPELKEKVKKEKEPEENATELQKEKQKGGKGAPKEAEEKKDEKWDVNNPPGPSSEVTIDTDEGTWMSLDVSPDGKEIAFDLLGDLYTIPIAGGEARALTHDVGGCGQHPEEEQREGRLRRDARDAGDRHVTALAAVEEVQIDVDGGPVAAEADRERTLHLIGVQRAAPFLTGRALHRLAGVGRHPDLGVHARDGDGCRPHLLRGHDPELGDAVRIRLVPRALVDGFGLGDDAVGAHLADLRNLRAHDHEVVELKELVIVDHDAERRGARVFGTEDPADLVVGHDALRSATAARRAR